jgi:hypothetical protein
MLPFKFSRRKDIHRNKLPNIHANSFISCSGFQVASSAGAAGPHHWSQKYFKKKILKFQVLVSQHAEDRGTTSRVTHKLNPSAKPLESRLILVTARTAVVLLNEIEPGHVKMWSSKKRNQLVA